MYIIDKNSKDYKEIKDVNEVTDFFKEAQKRIILVLQIKTKEILNQCDDLSPSIKDVTEQIRQKIKKHDKILITYHFGWCDWILFVSLLPNDRTNFSDVIFEIKEILLTNEFIKKSKTDILLGCKIENKKSISIPAPNILVRYSTSSKTKNLIGPYCIKTAGGNIQNWQSFLKPGIYDLLLVPELPSSITIKDFFDVLECILNKTHTISDIQTIINLPVNNSPIQEC